MGNIYFVIMIVGLSYAVLYTIVALLLIKYDPVTYKLYYKYMYWFIVCSYVVGLLASFQV